MKKLISVLLSITLAVLCFSSLVLSADTAETAQDGRSYVIWDADPTTRFQQRTEPMLSRM